MKINSFIKRISSMIIPVVLISINVFGADTSTDEFFVGKLDFIEKSGREGIVTGAPAEKKYLLTKGAALFVKRGDNRIALKIDDADGKYLKCSVSAGTTPILLLHGEDVYYSVSMNSSVKYGDAKKILGGMIKLYEDFVLEIESGEDPVVIAAAVNRFTSSFDIFIPEIKRLNDRYPEFMKADAVPPDELKDEASRLKLLEPRLKDAFYKIQMFAANEQVKKALDELQKVLSKMTGNR